MPGPKPHLPDQLKPRVRQLHLLGRGGRDRMLVALMVNGPMHVRHSDDFLTSTGNKFGQPAEATVHAWHSIGAMLVRTDQCGAVAVADHLPTTMLPCAALIVRTTVRELKAARPGGFHLSRALIQANRLSRRRGHGSVCLRKERAKCSRSNLRKRLRPRRFAARRPMFDPILTEFDNFYILSSSPTLMKCGVTTRRVRLRNAPHVLEAL
jgi:hypothetical protein